ncbi:MAG TPA: sodium:solute symporter family protein [Gemmatimonadaceae bacterium]|nr:sodium:solute symporter family protein [Gemmatimonadaceae bacterium]
MTFTLIDWLIVAAYFAFSFGIAIYYFRRASSSTSEFFLSGRDMSWWMAGTSMVATTFAADTPLAVTELVVQNGIAGNWLWWNAVAGGILTVFFFAKLWRRSGVMTDVEFVELRYSGKAAAALRGIKAVYFGLLMNCIIIGWVSLAMETVMKVLFPDLTLFGRTSFNILGLEMSAALVIVAVLVLVVAVYSLMSGLWGVVVTDVFQFGVAMFGTFVLAWFVLRRPEIGGLAGLRAKLPPETFRLLPTIGEAGEAAGILALTPLAFIAYVGVQWWSSWYPGAEPGGGGYIAQRMMSAKDERHAMFSALWFTIAHYCLRPWPWIIVALASMVMYPNLEVPREGFVMVMRDVLPAGLIGLLFAAFLAAFMSTISTQLNWGTSYLVNDLWRRFVKPDGDEKYYVRVSRWMTFALAIVGIVVTTQLDTIAGAWGMILAASAGLGLVLILRWYWWRINAWSELTATIVPILLAALALILDPFGVKIPGFSAPFPENLFFVVAVTTVAWVVATFLTRPTAPATLDTFYRRVHPAGPGWGPVAQRHPDVRPEERLGALAVNWVLGVLLVYSTLFGTGYLIVGRTVVGLVLVAIALVSAFVLWGTIGRSAATEPAASGSSR